MRMFIAEMRKSLHAGYALLILCAAVLAETLICMLPREYDDPYIREVYAKYTAQYAGAYTEKTGIAIRQRADEIAQLLSEYDAQKAAYLSGGALDAWNAYLEAYHAAKTEQSTVDYLVQKCGQWEQATDFSPQVFDDTDCLHRLSMERFDLIALCCVLLLTVPVFILEYAGGSADMLRTMRRGICPLCLAKLTLAAVYGFCVPLLLFAVRNACHPMQNGDAALQNLLHYTGYGSTTVRQYLLQNALIHAAEWAIAAVGICAVCTLCKNTVLSVFLAAFALIVPAYTPGEVSYLFCGSALSRLYLPDERWLLWLLSVFSKPVCYGFTAYRGWRRKQL